MNGDVDEGSQTQAQHGRVLTVKKNGAIEHIEKQVKVCTAPWKVRRHVLEQRADHLKIRQEVRET